MRRLKQGSAMLALGILMVTPRAGAGENQNIILCMTKGKRRNHETPNQPVCHTLPAGAAHILPGYATNQFGSAPSGSEKPNCRCGSRATRLRRRNAGSSSSARG